MNKIIKTIFLTLLLFFVGTMVYAEEAPYIQEIPEVVSPEKSSFVVIADVNVGDVNVEETETELRGTFTLLGKMGQQNNISYGITVKNDENEMVDFVSLGEDVSVQEGEGKILSFKYTYPRTLHGDLSFYLSAETKTGVPLGLQKIHEQVFSSAEQRAFSCISEENATKLTCTHKTGDKLMIAYYSGSIFSNPDFIREVEVKSSVPTVIQQEIVPGRYRVVISDENNYYELHKLQVLGIYGTIKNIVLHEEEGILSGVVTVDTLQLKENTLDVTVVDVDGITCEKKSLPFEGVSTEFTLESKCVDGTVEVVLLDKDGVMLASEKQPFSVKQFVDNRTTTELSTESTVSEMSATGEGNSKMVIIITGIMLALVLLLVLFMIRRKREALGSGDDDSANSGASVTALSIVIFGLLSFASPASALTLGASVWNTGAGEYGYGVTATLSSNKGTYAPGETMSVTSYYDFWVDVPAPLYKSVVTLGYAGPPYFPSLTLDYDLVAGNSPAIHWREVLINTMPVTTESHVSDFIIPAGTSNGAHFLSFRLLANTRDVGGFNQAPGVINSGRLTFNVFVALPSVNLYFQ